MLKEYNNDYDEFFLNEPKQDGGEYYKKPKLLIFFLIILTILGIKFIYSHADFVFGTIFSFIFFAFMLDLIERLWLDY